MPDTVNAAPADELCDTLLGVTHSLRGLRWRLRGADERTAQTLAQRFDLPETIGRLMAARGILPETAEDFLEPTLRRLMPDPSGLLDMDKAAARLADAIERGEKVAIFGDYDVDGGTSAALLMRYFRSFGLAATLYVPDRIAEGYGPNAPALVNLKAAGHTLIVTVDCGVSAYEAIGAAAAKGAEVIVLDHHLAEPALPPAYAIVNPNRLDQSADMRRKLGGCAAVGITFLTVVAVNRELRRRGYFAERPEPELKSLLDLVALGTVCDVVPLTGLNRAFVAQGLKVMATRGNAGLAALADVARVGEAPGAFHCGFMLGPRVNAGGRVGRSDIGARLLSSDDTIECRALAAELDRLNEERRAIEANVEQEALAQLAAFDRAAPFALVVGERWHPGVIGIVASRLKEKLNRPCFVVALDEQGIGKGSGRSVKGVDLGAAVIAARQQGLLINGGGHAMAAGLTVAAANIGALREAMGAHIAAQLNGALPDASLGIDASLPLSALTPELALLVEKLAPFGQANSEPRFVWPDCAVFGAALVGEKHVRCVLAPVAGGARVKAIAFRAAETPLGAALFAGGPLHVAGRFRIDRWNGRSQLDLQIEDAARPWAG
jgi:single-stranded-DNA-specific exonuclease